MSKEAIISKIRKLFATSRDQASSRAEVENALAATRRLMDKHAITENEIEECQESDVKEAWQTKSRRPEKWFRELGNAVAMITETQFMSKGGSNQRYRTFGFTGIRGDPDIALELLQDLVAIAKNLAKSKARCQRSYLLGFSNGISIAATKIRHQALSDSACTALISRKAKLITASLESEGIKTRKSRSNDLAKIKLIDFLHGRDSGQMEARQRKLHQP